MKRSILLLCTIACSLSVLAEEGFREFTDTQGRKIEARIQSVEGDQVKLVRRDGQEFTVSGTIFSPEDREYIQSWTAKSSMPVATSTLSPEQMNEALGHPVFSDVRLWDDTPEEVAQRLGWPRESKTPFVSSFRLYPPSEFRFLGARPFSVALYGEGDAVSSLSLVFANKGDSAGALGDGSLEEDDLLDALEESMNRDVETIASKLTSLLGEPERQRFGEGSGRDTVSRWDWNDHAFLLMAQDEEYVSLAIQSKSFADAGGTVERVREGEIRDRTRANVVNRENGDVVIGNLPMVDQGPKGYCAPATLERCMRYLGVPADMYLLAMNGQTGIGGGTNSSLLMEGASRDIKRKGRGFEIINKDLDLTLISRYIDEGIPVMWGMFSLDQFNEAADEQTEKRKSVDDWEAWASEIEEASENRDLSLRANSHLTLIVGYNKETEEIAFSDSWGERFLERWISLEDAQEVSQGRFYVVTF